MITEMETLSDHLYVAFTVDLGFAIPNGCSVYLRWSRNRFDKEMFREVVNLRLDCKDFFDRSSCDKKAKWLRTTLTMACDCAFIRIGKRSRSRYWWCDEIAVARRNCNAARREITSLPYQS